MNIGGIMGKSLNVDLSAKTTDSAHISDDDYLDLIGGYGVGCRVLYEKQRAKIDALSAESMFAVTTGPLTGTRAITGNRFTVVGKSPKTGTWGDANCGGTFGPGLKAAGVDNIFVVGASETPIYLLIENGEATIQDASQLWGLDSNETEQRLLDKHGKNARVACIGPAGERQSMLACIMNDFGRAAGRSGLGASMGSKKLKAVVAVGDRKVPVADPDRLAAARKKYIDGFKDNDSYELFNTYGTAGITDNACITGDTPIKNWAGVPADFPNSARISDDAVKDLVEKPYGCWQCPIACGGHVRVEGGKYAVATHKPEYETLGAFGTLCLNDSLESIVMANDICNRAGIDTIGAGTTVAFALECFEKGVLTKEEAGGLDLVWGNDEAIVELTDLIAKDDGAGKIFSNGISAAAKYFGEERVREFAMHIGGEELPMHDSRLNPSLATSYHVDATPGRHTQGGAWFHEASFKPSGIEKYYSAVEDKYTYTGKGDAAKFLSCYYHVVNAAGMCMFGAVCCDAEALPEFLSAVTGTEYSMEQVIEAGRRIATLRMAFNLREGIMSAKLPVPARLLGNPPLQSGPLKGVQIDNRTQTGEYLEAMGWDPESGRPTEETIEELGLKSLLT